MQVAKASTVRHLREDWVDPPDCKFAGDANTCADANFDTKTGTDGNVCEQAWY